jgi:hypothetical protein
MALPARHELGEANGPRLCLKDQPQHVESPLTSKHAKHTQKPDQNEPGWQKFELTCGVEAAAKGARLCLKDQPQHVESSLTAKHAKHTKNPIETNPAPEVRVDLRSGSRCQRSAAVSERPAAAASHYRARWKNSTRLDIRTRCGYPNRPHE